MATLSEFERLSVKERQRRYFSPEFKQQKVSEIERNLVTVREVCREYQVSSVAVYKWVYKYSTMRKKKEKMVFESESDTRKIIELKQRIKELEQALGQKQMDIDFMSKLIELTEEEYKIEIKKKGHGKR
jgi:transposase